MSPPHRRRFPRLPARVELDNVSTHQRACQFYTWLDERPRITVHFTPTSASWMNHVETWFSIPTRGAIRRGTFRSDEAFIERIDAFTGGWNAGASPFVLVKSADQILARAVRKRSAISELGR